jgi:hypothetical protein
VVVAVVAVVAVVVLVVAVEAAYALTEVLNKRTGVPDNLSNIYYLLVVRLGDNRSKYECESDSILIEEQKEVRALIAFIT